jgi:hypothetical protein
MRFILSVTTAAAMVLAASPAAGQARQAGAHIHGHASLALVLDRQALAIEFQTPAHTLYGFERAPRTAEERSRTEAVRRRLENPGQLFTLDAAAGCALQSRDLADLVPGRPGAAAETHEDVIARYSYACAAPHRLRHIDIAAFDAFPVLERVDIVYLGEGGQRAGTARPQRRRVDLK